MEFKTRGARKAITQNTSKRFGVRQLIHYDYAHCVEEPKRRDNRNFEIKHGNSFNEITISRFHRMMLVNEIEASVRRGERDNENTS